MLQSKEYRLSNRKISLLIHEAAHVGPLVRYIDVLVQMKWFGMEGEWIQFIAGQTQRYLPDGDQGVLLCDLQKFCFLKQLELNVITGLDEKEAKEFAIANCHLAGLGPTPEVLELWDMVADRRLSTTAAIQKLLSMVEK